MNERLRPRVALCVLLLWGSLPSRALAQPLSAAQALSEAIRNNPSLGATVSEVAAARARTTSEGARYDPTLTVALGGTHTDSPSLSPSSSGVQVSGSNVASGSATLQKTLTWGTQLSGSVGMTASKSSTPYIITSAQGVAEPLVITTGPGYLLSAKIGATQPLLRGAGREITLAPYQQAQAQETATRREHDRVANGLVRDVLLAYWELWYAEMAAEVNRAARETARAQRDDAQLRAQTGSLAPADVLTFETQLASKEEALVQADLERYSRQNALARLMGRDRGAELLEVSESEPPQGSAWPSAPVDRALQTSPDIGANQATLNLAELQARTTADAYRPRLDLDAYAQAQGLGNKNVGDALTQFGQLGVVSAHVGLTLEMPLADTRYDSEARRARSTLEAARLGLSATRNQVRADMATAVRKHELARQRIELAEVSIKYAEDQLTAKRSLFSTGSATALEVIQATDSVQSAKIRLARARADLVQADLVAAYHLSTLLNAVGSR